MPMKPCLDCGALSTQHRCPEHLAEWRAAKQKGRVRPSAHKRGYDAAWKKLRRTMIANQPFCTFCGATDDLTLDHIVARVNGGESSRDNAQVLCRSCNSRKSDRENISR